MGVKVKETEGQNMDEQEYFYCQGGKGCMLWLYGKATPEKYDNFISVRVDG